MQRNRSQGNGLGIIIGEDPVELEDKDDKFLNSHSQYEQKLRKHHRVFPEVSRNKTTKIKGSWRQPRVPVTRTSGCQPTARTNCLAVVFLLRKSILFNGSMLSEVAFFDVCS